MDECDRCHGQRWLIWRQRFKNGRTMGLVKACEKCNLDGKDEPPVHPDYDEFIEGDKS